MPDSINIHQAKTHLSKLIERVENGEEIVIARSGRPVARLCPLSLVTSHKRKPGRWTSQFVISDDFDKPLPGDILKGFTGEGSSTSR